VHASTTRREGLSERYASLWVSSRGICRGDDGAWIRVWQKSMAGGGSHEVFGWPTLWRGLIVAVALVARGGIPR
jgi:hypothetical protein